VNNLPKVVTWKQNNQELNRNNMNYESNVITITSPGHNPASQWPALSTTGCLMEKAFSLYADSLMPVPNTHVTNASNHTQKVHYHFAGIVEVVTGKYSKTAGGNQSLGVVNSCALQSHNHWNMKLQSPCGFYDSLSDDVAAHNAAEYVD